MSGKIHVAKTGVEVTYKAKQLTQAQSILIDRDTAQVTQAQIGMLASILGQIPSNLLNSTFANVATQIPMTVINQIRTLPFYVWNLFGDLANTNLTLQQIINLLNGTQG